MESYQTQSGRRGELEASLTDLNPYLGGIGAQIMPVNDVASKTGTYYYQDLEADAAAQTGRGNSAAPAEVVIGENSATWSAAEVIKRYVVPRDSVKTQFGSIDRADAFASRAALRSVLRKHETDVAALVLEQAGAVNDIEGSFIGTCQDALDSVHRYPGEKAFVCSRTIFNRIMNYSEITTRMGLDGAGNGLTAATILGGQQPVLLGVLSAIIGVDRILVGDDDIWYTADADYQDRAAIVSLPSPDQFSEMADAVFGKTIRYLPEGQEYPFFIETHFDEDDKTNKYDASIWYSLEVMNTGANVVLAGIDAANTVVTSTTTTA